MDTTLFSESLQKALPVGQQFENPGGGTSTILGYSDEKVSYRRGNSTISVAFSDLLETYKKFSGSVVTSSDLKSFRPSVFDSTARPAGHSCNCTFLIIALNRIGLAGSVKGGGVRGNPFYSELK